MPDDTDTLPIEAEAAMDTLEAQPDAEANGEQPDGTESANAAQAAIPDSQLRELTDAEINEALAQLRNPAFKPAKNGKSAKEEDTTETQDTDTSGKTAKADHSNVRRINIGHLEPDDRNLFVKLGDMTSGRDGYRKMSMAEALEKVYEEIKQTQSDSKTDAAPEAERATQEAPNALTAARNAFDSAKSEYKEANDEFTAAMAAFDSAAASKAVEKMMASFDKVNAANRELAKLEIRQQDAEARSTTEAQQAGAKELAGVQAKVPQLADPEDPLVNAYNELLDSLPDHLVGPGKVESVARMAWAQVYPGKPFPADIGGQEVVNPPKKSATHVAALQTGNRLGQNRIATALKTPGAERELSDEELDQLLKAARR